jgi:hypothetical protein
MLKGDIRLSDFQVLFSDLRMNKPGFATVRDICHFAAHRDERDNGSSLERVCEIEESMQLWFDQYQIKESGNIPNIAHIERAGRVNLKIIPESRIKDKLGISKQTATQTFNKALRKSSGSKPLKARETQILLHFGLSEAWEASFHLSELFPDFISLLQDEGALGDVLRDDLGDIYTSVSMYGLSIMHGAKLVMPPGDFSVLKLSVGDCGNLLVKAEIPIVNSIKEIVLSVPLFVADLLAENYCGPELLSHLKSGDLVSNYSIEMDGGVLGVLN